MREVQTDRMRLATEAAILAVGAAASVVGLIAPLGTEAQAAGANYGLKSR